MPTSSWAPRLAARKARLVIQTGTDLAGSEKVAAGGDLLAQSPADAQNKGEVEGEDKIVDESEFQVPSLSRLATHDRRHNLAHQLSYTELCSPIPGNDLYCEQTPLADLAARVGTPAYVYSRQAMLDNFRAYDEAFGDLPHTVCYAVKANSSLGVLALLAKAGAGFDIVSGGELYRVLQAGGDPAKVVFSGVGKTARRSGVRARRAGFTASTASRRRSWR